MIVNAPRAIVSFDSNKFEVSYVNYGNQDPAVAYTASLTQFCQLTHIKVPSLEEDFGQEAVKHLSELTLGSSHEFMLTIEEMDASGGKVKGQGTGTMLLVTLSVTNSEHSVNAVWDKAASAQKRTNKESQLMKRCFKG
ncbi:hypothetical protein MLD38_001069 [Melastoma candidum]|uniref:Uncharacterized protein n=1 Tax=Melastoma candidum TaxID=119954 RepID=A0ACB9SE05_9MYRT|nr:hypothetical protein MLD38_001069 [Melastoma candidum]